MDKKKEKNGIEQLNWTDITVNKYPIEMKCTRVEHKHNARVAHP